MASTVDSPSKRSKLAARENPYWQGVSGGRGGVSLGYRKPARGAGCWVAKIVIDGARVEERVGDADDAQANPAALSYTAAVRAALEWGRHQYAAIEARRAEASTARIPTVRSAVERYAAIRKQRSPRAGANAEGRLKRYVLSDKELADTRLARLRATALEEWRARLPQRLAATTINRLLNDLRAALNGAAEKYRRELPVYLPGEIKAGTKAASVSVNARRQILTDTQVRSVVEAAFAVDADGDFGQLVLLAAATGARFSQLTALTVADVQVEKDRVMIPTSRKGRGMKPPSYIAVPVGAEVIKRLTPSLRKRKPEEVLFLRWAYRSVGPLKWEKDKRRPWGPAYEIEKPWAATISIADTPADTVMYALRHSSIVRGLRAGLPIRLVAALHDTSVEMIEKHYAAFIVDMTDDLARLAVMSFNGASRPLLEAAE